jgi:hypothetical protein
MSRPAVTTHVVLFRMGAAFDGTLEEEASASCAGFVGQIPGVLSATFGRTFTVEHAKSFTHCLVVTFEHPSNLGTYGPHALHQAWASKFVNPYKEDLLKVDIDAVVHTGSRM